jgi:hypothetical protein
MDPNRYGGSFFSEFPAQIYSQATGVKNLCQNPLGFFRYFSFHTGQPENTSYNLKLNAYIEIVPGLYLERF